MTSELSKTTKKELKILDDNKLTRMCQSSYSGHESCADLVSDHRIRDNDHTHLQHRQGSFV